MSQHMGRSAPWKTAELASSLASARRAKGLTQAVLGARLGLPQSHISTIERGKTDLRLSSLINLARLLELEIMLIPRQYVPAVRSLTARPATRGETALEASEPAPSPYLYRLEG